MSSTNIPIYDSAQRVHPALEELRESIRYRYLIRQIVRRDILTRYKRSVLGVAWSMLNPLGMMVVMTVVFSTVFGRDESYPAYLLSGLLAWNFMAEATTSIMRNLVWGSSLLQRIYVPRTAFAISSIGTGLVNLALSVIPLVLVMLVVGVPIRLSILFTPIAALLLTAFSLGLGLLLSVFAMYFPDVSEMYKVALRAWMYLTPIIYGEELLANGGAKWLLVVNPMRYLVNIFRIPIREGRIPVWEEFWPAALIAGVMLAVGWLVFTRQADEFAYRV